MAAEMSSVPVFVRFGDGEEREIGTLTVGPDGPDAATLGRGPYPLDFADADSVDRLRDQLDNVLYLSRIESSLLDEAEVLISTVDEEHGAWRQSIRWERAARRWLDAYAPGRQQ